MLDAPLKPLPVNGKGEEAYLARAFNRLSAQSVEQRRTIADLMTQLSVWTVGDRYCQTGSGLAEIQAEGGMLAE